MNLFHYFLTIIGLIFLADFISGIGHWIEDAYGNPNWRFFGDVVIKPNLEHHKTPRSFLSRSYWHRNSTSILATTFIALCIFCIWGG
jgi:ubiquitin-conjugating enzyme E2 variant